MPCTQESKSSEQPSRRVSIGSALGRIAGQLRFAEMQDMQPIALNAPFDQNPIPVMNQININIHNLEQARLGLASAAMNVVAPNANLVHRDPTEQIRISVRDTHISHQSSSNSNRMSTVNDIIDNCVHESNIYRIDNTNNGNNSNNNNDVNPRRRYINHRYRHNPPTTSLEITSSPTPSSSSSSSSSSSDNGLNPTSPPTSIGDSDDSLDIGNHRNITQQICNQQQQASSSSSVGLQSSPSKSTGRSPSASTSLPIKSMISKAKSLNSTVRLVSTKQCLEPTSTTKSTKPIPVPRSGSLSSCSEKAEISNQDYEYANVEKTSPLLASLPSILSNPSTQVGVIKNDLWSGSSFSGYQRSQKEHYGVNVTLQHVNYEDSYLCGYLCINNLTKEHKSLTTFFEGEIISAKHPFLTRKWDSNDDIDRAHWSRFEGFQKYIETYNLDSFEYDDLDKSDYIFMRWKEMFLVPDHTIKYVEGASYAGFYYVCYSKRTSSIKGYYFHISDVFESFQSLDLELDQHQGTSQVYEFR